MRLRSVLVLISFALMLAFLVDDADGAQKKKKKGGLKGTVESVERIKESKENKESKDTLAMITIKAKGKKGAPGAEAKVEISKETKIEKAAGKKKQNVPAVAGTLDDIQKGSQLIVAFRQGSTTVADKVTIGAKKKKKAT
jgi:hypothetical protein